VDVVKFAYADPPYIGCAGYYAEREEVDHAQLITRLVDEFPDGWALSCHTPSLRLLLPMTPEDTRVMAWVKPWAVFKPNVNPAYAWEPVLVRGGRKRARNEETERDWVSAGITLKRGMVGVKPDLYPGTGAVTRAWLQWRDRLL
jgi:hypothetical protein